jgi:hypothetical protein
MNLNFNFPDLVADPSYSFAPTGTVLPPFPRSADTNTAEGSRDDDVRRYDVELRRVLAGQTEGLEVQEERVYRAEVSVVRRFRSRVMMTRTTSMTSEVDHELKLFGACRRISGISGVRSCFPRDEDKHRPKQKS